ncbi:MAG: hypothetical protein ABIH20_02430 [Candidatus Diapherotrites archaeon]
MEKKIIYASIGIIVLVLAAFLLLSGNNVQNDSLILNEQDSEKQVLLSEQRISYKLSPAIFSELPLPPNDFNKIVSLYHSGGFRDELFFSEKYFLQPEFYPSFMKNGLNYWLNPPTTHYAAYGYGSYPIKKTVFVNREENVKTRFFFHSGYGVRSYQGFKLDAFFEDEEAKEFFDVSIKEPIFLIGPNFPKFEKNWAKDVELNVFVKPEAPQGTYNLKIINDFPPEEFKEKWAQEINGKYFDAGFVSIDRPVFELILVVE